MENIFVKRSVLSYTIGKRRLPNMMYPYMTLADETEITHSHLIKENGQEHVEVHFERPTENGFDTARCSLPSYEWMEKKGYTDKEITFFEEYLHNNAHLILRFAETGGMTCA